MQIKINNFILGHNSFFGINHADYEKGKDKSEKFKNNSQKIINILSYANEKKINKFMISTLDESEKLMNEIGKTNLNNDLDIYVLLPYINKYVRKSNELGLLGVIKDQLKKGSVTKNIKYSLDFSSFLLDADFKKILSILIDIELQAFSNSKKKVIILHDALTDILVALEREDVIKFFVDFIITKYKCEPGFATKNFPRLNKFFNSFLSEATILTHANKLGFNMNPEKELAEKEFKNSKYNLIFMSVMASGYLDPKTALDYINNINTTKKDVVIGCSTKDHIDQLVHLLRD